MAQKIFGLLVLCVTFLSSAQTIQVNQKDSYKSFVEILENSKDSEFNTIINAYDAYIDSNPDDVNVRVYKCRFIGTAYYDEYEDYNLKYEETIDCLDQLYNDFPEHPEVVLYKLEYTYSEEKEDFLYDAMALYNKRKEDWSYQQAAKLYEDASYYYVEDDDYKAITYANKATRLSDSLDLSVLLTRAHMRMGNIEEAKESLLNALYYDGEAWNLQQKGELLVELGHVDEALKMFDRVKEKDSTYSNNESLYKIFLDTKDYKQARTYLVNDTISEWNKTQSIQKLLNHDISYSSVDVALVSYRRMQELSYYDDFFGIKRLRLYIKSPFKSWTLNEFSHILVLFAFVMVLLLLPYLLVVPIYGVHKFLKLKPIPIEKQIPVNWTLIHLWLISFVYLISQMLLVFILYYQDYMNHYFDLVYSYAQDEILESQLLTANSILLYTIIVFAFTLLFLNRKRLKFVFHSDIRYIRIAVLSILFFIVNLILLRILRAFIPMEEGMSFIQALSMREEMNALLFEYGFWISVLAVAVIVPFYEEVMFRGIILSSTEKKLGFKTANVIQATLFAIVHFSLSLFIFYFIFGLITGFMVKRTNGLLSGIVFHAVNNFFVLLALYLVSQYFPTVY